MTFIYFGHVVNAVCMIALIISAMMNDVKTASWSVGALMLSILINFIYTLMSI